MNDEPKADAVLPTQEQTNPFRAAWVEHEASRQLKEVPAQPQCKTLPLHFNTPERIKQGLEDLSFLVKSLENDTFETAEFFSAANRVFADQIQVGGPEGSIKELIGIVIPPGAPGLIPKLKVTLQDGIIYVAPATLPNRDDSDEDMMVIPFGCFFAEIEGRRQFLENLLGGEKKERTTTSQKEGKQ